MCKFYKYINILQGHPTVAYTDHTKESLKFITEYLPLKDYSTLLNIGCADGAETNSFKELGYKVVGITKGSVNVEYAKNTYNIDTYEMDMHDLHFKDGVFDSIYMSETFEHAFAPFIFMIELNRVLRLGGRIYTSMPAFVDKNLQEHTNSECMISHHHPNLLYKEQYENLFDVTGFKILEYKEDRTEGGCRVVYVLEKTNENIHDNLKAII